MNKSMRHPAATLAALALLALSASARAHEVRPAVADLSVDRAGGYQVSIELNLEALLAGIGPAHSDTSEAPGAAFTPSTVSTVSTVHLELFCDSRLAGPAACDRADVGLKDAGMQMGPASGTRRPQQAGSRDGPAMPPAATRT